MQTNKKEEIFSCVEIKQDWETLHSNINYDQNQRPFKQSQQKPH